MVAATASRPSFWCGCSGDQPTVPPSPSSASISILPATVELAALGDTARLAAEVRDQNGDAMPEAGVRWSSSAATVATVDTTGLVPEVAAGRTEVTATSGGHEASAAVTVACQSVSISLDRPELSFAALRDTATLTATAVDWRGRTGGAYSIRWASDDTTVAAVDPRGRVTAAGNGTTSVSATSGAVSARAVVVVRQVAAAVSLLPDSLTFEAPGDTATLIAAVADANVH